MVVGYQASTDHPHAQATQLKQAQSLITHYPKMVYTPLAHLVLAQQALQNNHLKKAETMLDAVINAPSISPQLKSIARLRQARLLIAQKSYQQASNNLDTITDPAFIPLVRQLQKSINPRLTRRSQIELTKEIGAERQAQLKKTGGTANP